MLAEGAQTQGPAPGQPAQRSEPKIFHHAFTADALSVRHALRTALARFLRQLSPDQAGTLELVLAEVLNNIVEHGYKDTATGTITLSLVRDHRGLSCSISDDGVELPPNCLTIGRQDAARPLPQALPEGGFGWFLIHDLVEDLGYHRANGRNLLAFRLPLRNSPPQETLS